MAWARIIGGVVMVLVGVLWFFQGIGVAKGSFMTGDATYSYLGAALAILGAALLVRELRLRRTGSNV